MGAAWGTSVKKGIVVMSGPWLVGAYYLGPKGWTLLELPDYDLGH